MIRFAGLSPDERRLGATLADTLRHRGPDEAGLWSDGVATLGHRRLSIIDLQGGHQPAANEDGSIHVVFNGEIYNFRALADDLRRRGHALRSHCDTEVIAHLYEDFGDEFVHKLNGMFAIAIWDSRQRRLLLVRDRLGIKPLYWLDDGRRILFGSEIKAILASAGVSRRIDARAFCDYLTFGHVPAPRTIFENIRKLEPGCLAVCTAGGTRVHRWWDIPVPDRDLTVAPSDREAARWTEEFAALLEDAVRLRLVADVPLGAFLSGGVDSASVAAAMCRQSKDPVLTHTVGFDEHRHDERTPARLVAERLGTDHREVVVRSDAARAADALTRYFDEPFGDASAIPTYHLSRITRERVKVALAGDGADEMLGGYRRYGFDLAESAVRARCPAWLRHTLFGLAGDLYPKGDWLPRTLRAKRTLQNLAYDDVTAHLRSVSLAAGTLPDLLLRPETLEQLGDHDPFARSRDLYTGCPANDRLSRLLYLDMKTLLPDDMLTKVDRASMAVGLEVRAPLLDYRLVELAARMPAALKFAGRQGKVVLRRVVADWLGPDVARRPKKGFDVPVDEWFRGELRHLAHDALLSSDTLCDKWIDTRAISRLLQAHAGGMRNNGAILWALLSFELWARAYIGSPATHTHGCASANEASLVEAGV